MVTKCRSSSKPSGTQSASSALAPVLLKTLHQLRPLPRRNRHSGHRVECFAGFLINALQQRTTVFRGENGSQEQRRPHPGTPSRSTASGGSHAAVAKGTSTGVPNPRGRENMAGVDPEFVAFLRPNSQDFDGQKTRRATLGRPGATRENLRQMPRLRTRDYSRAGAAW